VAAKLNKEIPNSFYPNQYDNLSNTQAHYETTGPEIWEQSEGKVTHLVVGVGTGGTICGVGKFLKEKNPKIKVWGIDTYGSVFKKYKETGIFDKNEIYPYITEGIGEDFLPRNVDFSVIDHFEKVTDKDAAIMTRELTRREGIFAGNSAGAAIAGILQLKKHFKENDVVVVIFHDHGIRYLGKMFNDEWMRNRGFLETRPTAKTIVESRKEFKLITVGAKQKIEEALSIITSSDISQLPVARDGEIIGSVSESTLFARLIRNPAIKNETVDTIMEQPFPEVKLETPLEEVSRLISQQNSAVLVKNTAGTLHIITKHDLIKALC
jgi:cystathionine beta-synthase